MWSYIIVCHSEIFRYSFFSLSSKWTKKAVRHKRTRDDTNQTICNASMKLHTHTHTHGKKDNDEIEKEETRKRWHTLQFFCSLPHRFFFWYSKHSILANASLPRLIWIIRWISLSLFIKMCPWKTNKFESFVIFITHKNPTQKTHSP